MMGVIFPLGCFLDWTAIPLTVAPVIMPVIHEVEMNAIWFSILICVNLPMACLKPPFGMSMFHLKGIVPKEMTMAHIYKGMAQFVALRWIGLLPCIH